MDYYSILGVNKNATPEEIKKAYRKLAMAHHPDRTGGDDTRFKQIQEAYATLSDNNKKQQYDNPQPQFNYNANDFRGHNPFNGAHDIFGRPTRQRQRNPDITISVSINLVDALIGKNLIAVYRLRTGKEETVEISIPKGAKDSDTIRYHGLGDDILPAPRGDLHVQVRIPPHPTFRRDQEHLYVNHKIDIFNFLLGGSIVMKTIEGTEISITIPQGTKPGTTFSVKGYGMPNMRTGDRGIMYVTMQAIVPKITDTKILEELGNIRRQIGKY
jgi:curved DNA-binding protein